MMKEPGSESLRISLAASRNERKKRLPQPHTLPECMNRLLKYRKLLLNSSHSVSEQVTRKTASEEEGIPSFLVMVGLYQNEDVSRSNFSPGIFGLSG